MRTSINAQVLLTPPPFLLFEMGEAGGGRTPLDKERLQRAPGKPPGIIKIEPAADRAIDRLVYELSRKGMIYGLS